MSIPPASVVPSVVIIRPLAGAGYNPIHQYRIPRLMRTAPQSVIFPGGHASFPAVAPQTLVFSNAIQSFTQSLAEFLEQPIQEKTPEAPPSIQITPETARTLKQAFELLQTQLQEGLELLPETKQPLPKALLQVLVQAPVFIEQLRDLLQNSSIKQPVLEEAEVAVKLPLAEISGEKLQVLEELQRNIPVFVKTLRAAFEALPIALSPVVKEALEKYLLSPIEQAPPTTTPEEGRVPVLAGAPLLQEPPPESVPVLKTTPQKEATEPLAPSQSGLPGQVAELPEILTPTQIPPKIKKEFVQEEAPLLISQPLEKKGEQVPLVKSSSPEEIVRPPSLTKLPELALREILAGAYPLLKTLLGLVLKEAFIPQEIVTLLSQLPPSLEQLKQLLTKEPSLLTPEQKETLRVLQFSIPTLIENLKEEVLYLPKFLFPEIRGKLEAFVKAFPLQELANFSAARGLNLSTPASTESRVVRFESFVKQEEAQTTVFIFEKSGIVFEGMNSVVSEPYSYVIEAEYPNYINLSAGNVAGAGGNAKIESPVTVPVFTIAQSKEEVKPTRQPPEFSTDIPFAFIVPYVAFNPIQTPPPEVKITPHDPWKEEFKEESGGSGGSKRMLLLAYIPRGETWHGNHLEEGGMKSFSLHSYAIGVYLVTNQQFASFLTEQSRLKNIFIGERGQIFSKDKVLLCQIKSGTVESDIEIEPQSNYLFFKVSLEKESYPVVCVTYHGAKAFCEFGGFRLPTDIEWEKAASLEMTEKNKVKRKFIFGCSQDDITAAFANYDTPDSSSLEVFTTPVGFYNGRSSFIKDGVKMQTFDARSPLGCYDMSGNVWEWTEGEKGGHATVKGGCFQSKESDLKVFVKKNKAVNSLDGLTGFRVALS